MLLALKIQNVLQSYSMYQFCYYSITFFKNQILIYFDHLNFHKSQKLICLNTFIPIIKTKKVFQSFVSINTLREVLGANFFYDSLKEITSIYSGCLDKINTIAQGRIMGCINSSTNHLPITKLNSMKVQDANYQGSNIDKSSQRNLSSERVRDKNRRKINKVQFLDQGEMIHPTQNILISTEQFTLDDKNMLDGVLSKNNIFHKLSAVQRKQLISRFVLYDSSYQQRDLASANKTNSHLFNKNDVGTLFFVIKSGSVQIQFKTLQQNDKKEEKYTKIKKILTRGQSFGQLALLYKTLRSASVKCLQKCTFLCLSSYIFKQTLQNIAQKTIESNKILIDRIRLFQYLTLKQKNRLANNIISLKYQKGDVIFRKGEDSVAFFVIVSGKVEIQIKNKSSLQLKPGDYFGQSCFIQNSKRSGTAICTEKTQLMSITKPTLQKLLGEQNQEFYFYSILKWSLKRNPIFSLIPSNSVQKLLNQSDIICFQHDHEILRRDQKIKKVYIPIQGSINGYQIGQIINCQYLGDIQSDKKFSATNPFTLVKNQEGYVCAMDIGKIMIKLQKNSIQISKIDPKAVQDMKKSIHSRKQIQSGRHRFTKKLTKERNTSIKLQHLKIVKKIGDGQFGSIYKVRSIIYNQLYALKILKKSQIDSYKMRHFVKQEIEVMEMIDCNQFIVGHQKHFQTDEFIMILMELIDGKNLFDTILEIGWLSTELVRFFFATYVLALEYLHEKDIIYRDVKPENAVIEPNGYLKLIDLGTSRKLTPSTGYRSFTIIGTPHYMAPQVIAGKGYSFEADIWSLGVLLFEIACGRFPFGQKLEEPIQIYNEIMKNNSSIIYPKQFKDKSLKRLVKRLLIKEPTIREFDNFTEIKDSEFYKDFDWSKFNLKTMKSPFKPSIKPNAMAQENKKSSNNEILVNYLERLKLKTLKENPTVAFQNWDEF